MARELTLIVTDLHLDADSASMEAPPLEALEVLLSRARSRENSEWRQWLASVAGIGGEHPSVAAISRCADQLPQAGEWWLASPAHFEVGLDRVRLSRLLTPAPEEWLELEPGLASGLDTSVVTFGGSSGPNAYLRASRPIRAETIDPARVLGMDVHGYLPKGEDSAPLKRVMTELQMWLHEHPVNARRERRGALPLNAFWIWGGGSLPTAQLAGARELPHLFSDDAYATGLWRLADALPQPLGQRLDTERLAVGADTSAASSTASARPTIIAVTLRHLAGQSDGERMKVLDQAWIAPALALLRGGAVHKLRVHLNDQLFTVTRFDTWRAWRRRRSWPELVG